MKKFLLFLSLYDGTTRGQLNRAGAMAISSVEPMGVPRGLRYFEGADGKVGKSAIRILTVQVAGDRVSRLTAVHGFLGVQEIGVSDAVVLLPRKFRDVLIEVDPKRWASILAQLIGLGFILPEAQDLAYLEVSDEVAFLTGRTGLSLDELRVIEGIDQASDIVREDKRIESL